MCEERGLKVDKAAYESAMEKAKNLSRAGGNFSNSMQIEMAADEVDTLKVKMAIPPTDDTAKWEWDSANAKGAALATKVRAIIDVKKAFLQEEAPLV